MRTRPSGDRARNRFPGKPMLRARARQREHRPREKYRFPHPWSLALTFPRTQKNFNRSSNVTPSTSSRSFRVTLDTRAINRGVRDRPMSKELSTSRPDEGHRPRGPVASFSLTADIANEKNWSRFFLWRNLPTKSRGKLPEMGLNLNGWKPFRRA